MIPALYAGSRTRFLKTEFLEYLHDQENEFEFFLYMLKDYEQLSSRTDNQVAYQNITC